jgi:hypothetical protein
MIFALGMLFLMLGVLLSSFDIFLPAYPSSMMMLVFALRIFGMMLNFLGLIILGIRISGTNTGMWLDLPSDKWINLIHSHIRGADPDAKFLRAKRLDLETLRSKKKLFKDVGGSFRISGHSCRRTYETIGFTVPDWLSDYFHKVKKDFGLTNSDEFRELKSQLKELKSPKEAPFKSIEEQLTEITLLKPIMNDPVNKKVLLDMDIKQLKDLEYMFYDGVTHNGDGVELFIDSATPNELDILEGQTFMNEMDRQKQYRDKGTTDWLKYMPWLIIMMFAAVIVIMIMKGLG